MLKIGEITGYLEKIAPPALQQSYDNAGLILGDVNSEVSAVLVTLDVTEEVVDEAIKLNAGLIVAHHPLVFSGLKKITGKTAVERTLLKAVRNNIAVFASHTNIDSIENGVNGKICEKIGLTDCRILQPAGGKLKKLVTFIPEGHADKVRIAVFEAGAGHIGNYDYCGYNLTGKGSFRGNEDTNPFVGEKNKVHYEEEIRFETIFPAYLQQAVLQALLDSHPYEEVAYDIYPLDNRFNKVGDGMTGVLPEAIPEMQMLELLKKTFGTGCIRHTKLMGKPIRKIAVCGGAGSFLLPQAIAAGADFFVSADFKYHQFFDTENRIVIADIGHFESEQFTKELFYELLTKKFPKFAIHFSEVVTNPVYYF